MQDLNQMFEEDDSPDYLLTLQSDRSHDINNQINLKFQSDTVKNQTLSSDAFV